MSEQDQAEMQQPGPQAAPKKSWLRRNGLWLAFSVVAAIVIAVVLQAVNNHVAGNGGLCTSSSCVVSDLNSGLVGLTAKDDLVTTKAVCVQSSEQSEGNGIYAATCTVTYSDRSTATGTGTLDTTQNQVSFTLSLP
jgi:hypothetical protein